MSIGPTLIRVTNRRIWTPELEIALINYLCTLIFAHGCAIMIWFLSFIIIVLLSSLYLCQSYVIYKPMRMLCKNYGNAN